MSKKILIKCDEATTICDKSQYGEASAFDKMRLSLHNFLCHRCKLYTEQNKVMTKILKVHLHKPTEQHLCDSDKETLQKALEEEIKNLG
jgi:hypothetical protein